MVDILDFNNVYGTQSGLSINPDSINFVHGSYVSSMTFDSVTKMSFEYFKEKELPTLPNTEADQYLIRDLSNNRIFVLMPDCVLKIKVTDLAEISGTQFKSMISNGNEDIKTQVFNSKVPIYEYGCTANNFTMTLKIPSVKMLFRHVPNRSDRGKESIIPIYLPDVLYTIQASHQGTITKSKIFVLVDDKGPKPAIGHLYFPNVFSNGNLCLGTIRRDSASSFKNDYDVTMAAFQIWCNSKFDDELLSDHVPVIPEVTELDPIVAGSSIASNDLKRLLTVLRKPEGWKEVQWRPASDKI